MCVQMCAGVHGANVVNVKCLPSFFSILFFKKFIYFYFMSIDWCFYCMYVPVRVLDPLELDLETVVSFCVGAGN